MAERVVVTINDLNIDAVTKDDLDDLKKILGSLGETTTVIIYATGVDLFKNKSILQTKTSALQISAKSMALSATLNTKGLPTLESLYPPILQKAAVP